MNKLAASLIMISLLLRLIKLVLSALYQVEGIILGYFCYFEKAGIFKFFLYGFPVVKEYFYATKHFKPILTYKCSLSIGFSFFCDGRECHKPILCQLVVAIADKFFPLGFIQ